MLISVIGEAKYRNYTKNLLGSILEPYDNIKYIYLSDNGIKTSKNYPSENPIMLTVDISGDKENTVISKKKKLCVQYTGDKIDDNLADLLWENKSYNKTIHYSNEKDFYNDDHAITTELIPRCKEFYKYMSDKDRNFKLCFMKRLFVETNYYCFMQGKSSGAGAIDLREINGQILLFDKVPSGLDSFGITKYCCWPEMLIIIFRIGKDKIINFTKYQAGYHDEEKRKAKIVFPLNTGN